MREDDVRAIGNLDPRKIDADLGERFELGEQTGPANDRAAPDEEFAALLQHGRRNDAERELPIAHANGVAGVVAAAEARHDVEIARVIIDDTALAFVTPLQADDYVDVSPIGIGETPSNDVRMYSLKRAFGQPKSTRVYRFGSLGSNDSCSR